MPTGHFSAVQCRLATRVTLGKLLLCLLVQLPQGFPYLLPVASRSRVQTLCMVSRQNRQRYSSAWRTTYIVLHKISFREFYADTKFKYSLTLIQFPPFTFRLSISACLSLIYLYLSIYQSNDKSIGLSWFVQLSPSLSRPLSFYLSIYLCIFNGLQF